MRSFFDPLVGILIYFVLLGDEGVWTLSDFRGEPVSFMEIFLSR
jgi:hypothetical protein